jgi:hypothetical protein
MVSKIWLSSILVSLLIATGASGQEGGDQVTYKFDSISVDDPDLIIGGGIGMYMPGLLGYEFMAMANEIVVPNLWGDLHYVSSTGLVEDMTLLADATELKVRAGWKLFGGVAPGDTAITLKSDTWTEGNTRYTKTVSLPVNVPRKESTIFFGSMTQRGHVFVEKDGDKETVGTETTTLIGGGVRWQSYENVGVDIDNLGYYHQQNLFGHEIELMQGDKGVFKGLHWAYSFDSHSFPWYLRTAIGSGLSGLDESVEIIDTFMVQIGFGYTFSTQITRSPIDWDPDCWQSKRDDMGCRK